MSIAQSFREAVIEPLENARKAYTPRDARRFPDRARCPVLKPGSARAVKKMEAERTGRFETRSPDWGFVQWRNAPEIADEYERIARGEAMHADDIDPESAMYLESQVLITITGDGALLFLGDETRHRVTEYPGAPDGIDYRTGKHIENLNQIVVKAAGEIGHEATARQIATMLNTEAFREANGMDASTKYVAVSAVRKALKSESADGKPAFKPATPEGKPKAKRKRYGYKWHIDAVKHEATGAEPASPGAVRCAVCGTDMPGARPNKVTCSKPCRDRKSRSDATL